MKSVFPPPSCKDLKIKYNQIIKIPHKLSNKNDLQSNINHCIILKATKFRTDQPNRSTAHAPKANNVKLYHVICALSIPAVAFVCLIYQYFTQMPLTSLPC